MSQGFINSSNNVVFPIPLTQGGTGTTTASGAFTALKQAASTSATGVVQLATQANMVASTSGVVVTADVQKYHPGVIKAWIKYDGTSSGFLSGYNISSLTDNGVGTWSVNFTTSFADTNFLAIPNQQNEGGGAPLDWRLTGTISVSTYGMRCWNNNSNALADASYICIVFVGTF